MPLNPKGTMFPFNGDISGVVAAAGRCWGGLAWLPGPSHAAPSLALFTYPLPRVPSALFMAGQHLVNLIEGFVPSILAHQFGGFSLGVADIVRQPGPGWPLLFQEMRVTSRIINRRTAGVINPGRNLKVLVLGRVSRDESYLVMNLDP